MFAEPFLIREQVTFQPKEQLRQQAFPEDCREVGAPDEPADAGVIEAAGYFAANYANPDYINRYFGAALQKRFGLWLASWPKGSVNANKPPVGCVMWQWGSSNVDGITGGVDSNFCYTSFAAKAVPAQASAEVPQASAEVPQVVPAWKLEIADKALAASIITDPSWKDKLDETAPVWMVLAAALNAKGAQQ